MVKSPKPIAFRPSERSEQIIYDTMKAKTLESTTDALNYIIENSQSPQANAGNVTPLRSISPYDIELRDSDKLPANLDRELQRFLRGQESPIIHLLFSDIPNKNPSLVTTLIALHDT